MTVTSSALNFYRLVPLPVFIYLNFTIFVYWYAYLFVPPFSSLLLPSPPFPYSRGCRGSFVSPATRHIVFRLLVSWPTAMYHSSACWGLHTRRGERREERGERREERGRENTENTEMTQNRYQASCLLMLPLTWVTWIFTQWFVLGVVTLCVIGFLQSSLLIKEYPFVKVTYIIIYNIW